ncbi:MAG: glycoside hydrolase family 3 C-terminal domain-containing protein, partial [Lachnospiraceae bacterium]|nr:glycoside hydrolase family 3 C-terminal domain-containing protein [Lachnospiraceae bacterium]
MTKKISRRDFLRGSAAGAAGLVLTGMLGGRGMLVSAEEADGMITVEGEAFPRMAESGQPVFVYPEGEDPADYLDAFVDMLLGDMSIAQKECYAYHALSLGGVEITVNIDGEDKTYIMPQSKGERDAVQGVSTDFPALTGLGQTWNTDLIYNVGTVMGEEKRSSVDSYDGMTMIYSAVGDIRMNTLGGRIDESFSDDPSLGADMVTAMGTGVIGTKTEENTDSGFWIRCGLGTKHYATYSTEWLRNNGVNYSSGLRSLYEYQLATYLEGAQENAYTGSMLSLGTTNGIPTVASYYINYIEMANDKYHLWNIGDGDGEKCLDERSADTYDEIYLPDGPHMAALLMLSGGQENGSGKWVVEGDYESAIEQGIFGVTEEDLNDNIRGQLEMFVREGCFCADSDGDGYPDDYIYSYLVKEGTKTNTDEESQAVAYQAAVESTVLLKNENSVLPLSAEEYSDANKLTVAGFEAYTRWTTHYAASTPSRADVANSGLTVLDGIRTVLNGSVEDGETIVSSLGVRTVAFKTSEGKYLTVAEDTSSRTITAEDQILDENGTIGERQQFYLYDPGMGSYMIRSVYNNAWLGESEPQEGMETSESLLIAGTESTGSSLDYPLGFENKGNEGYLGLTNGSGLDITQPIRIIDGLYGGFMANHEIAYKSTTVYSISDGVLVNTESGVDYDGDDQYFEVEEVAPVDVTVSVAGDTAIVVVGPPAGLNADEGADRYNLSIGEENYALVHDIAAAYEKTVVVVKATSPVDIDELQNDENVDAIIYQNYAGEYDGYALANILFGNDDPSGHLTISWYNTMNVFSPLDESSVPTGKAALNFFDANAEKEGISYEDINPYYYDVDLADADLVNTKLTYMFVDSENITYPFGHGLSYSSFAYTNAEFVDDAENDTIEVTVDIENTSERVGQTVAQVYVKPQFESAYGDGMYKIKLIGFAKIALEAGETQTVTISWAKENMKLDEVNGAQRAGEAGEYAIV